MEPVVRGQDQGHDRPVRATLKKRWGTMQKVISAGPRTRQIVNDILLDMQTKPRLMDGRATPSRYVPASVDLLA